MTKFETIIKHPAQLNKMTSFSMARRRGLGLLKLSSEFVHSKRGVLEEQLNKYYYACGCSQSAKMFIFGLLLGGLALLLHNYYPSFAVPAWYWTVPGLGIAGGILGKVYGLSRANHKLRQTASEIQSLWTVPTNSHEDVVGDCG